MKTAQSILRRKSEVFSELESTLKLIEELEEALFEARTYAQLLAYGADLRKTEQFDQLQKLVEELADVEVAGTLTFKEYHEQVHNWYNWKIMKGVFEQIQEAINEAEAVSGRRS